MTEWFRRKTDKIKTFDKRKTKKNILFLRRSKPKILWKNKKCAKLIKKIIFLPWKL